MDVGTSQPTGIQIQVTGQTEIDISDDQLKTIGRCSSVRTSLHYFSGRFRSGTSGAPWIDASILPFDNADAATVVHNHCTKFYHPYVMRSLGYGKGSGVHSRLRFVAFPSFSTTLAECLLPGSGAATMGRYTERFSQIVSQLVQGMNALHQNGFDCPEMRGKHVAIIEETDCITVKIWNFRVHHSGKHKGWSSLGSLLREAANNNLASGKDSLEITDLCNKMISGKLKGLDILKHSALLTVRQKFDNVLAVNLHVLLSPEPAPVESSTELAQNQSSGNLSQEKSSTGLAQNQSSADLSQKKSSQPPTEVYDLMNFLDVPNTENEQRPTFIQNIRNTNRPTTFRRLLDELRDIIEHEVEYFPPEMTRKFTPKELQDRNMKTDLEHHFRKAWSGGFLKIQLWAVDPSAKLPR